MPKEQIPAPTVTGAWQRQKADADKIRHRLNRQGKLNEETLLAAIGEPGRTLDELSQDSLTECLRRLRKNPGGQAPGSPMTNQGGRPMGQINDPATTPGQLFDALLDRLGPSESLHIIVHTEHTGPRHVAFEVSDKAPLLTVKDMVRSTQWRTGIDCETIPPEMVEEWADGMVRELRRGSRCAEAGVDVPVEAIDVEVANAVSGWRPSGP